jgi:hypothetical protein
VENLLTDDMDIRDTVLGVDVGGNGDYYLSLTETKNGKVVRLDTRIAMRGGNATPEARKAIADLYRALRSDVSDGHSGLNKHSVSDLLFAFATRKMRKPISAFNRHGFKEIVSEFLANYKR